MFEATLPYKTDIQLHQGATFTRTLSWLTSDTQEPVIDLNDFHGKMTMRSLDGKTTIDLSTLTGGITFVPTQGRIVMTVTAAQTASLVPTAGSRKWGEYDLLIYPKTGAEPNYYLVRGDVHVTKRVTTR